MKLLRPAAVALALGSGLLLLQPPSTAFTLLGHSLDTDARDFRVFDNFADASANDNTTPDPQFPGATGAALAIWKGCAEWGSTLHGDGSGDPTQPGDLGSGGANFDSSYQGMATGIGLTMSNTFSAISTNGNGVYGFYESFVPSVGWRIRFHDGDVTWKDGPGSGPSNQVDLQGVAAALYGLALGLGTSTVPGATMVLNGPPAQTHLWRSIEADDVAGLTAIYGAASASKPVVSSAVLIGSSVSITGSGFAATGNEVWFTQAGAGGTGEPVKATGVASPDGLSLSVLLPAAAGSGDVLVKLPGGTSGDLLSNAFPFDANPPLVPPAISLVTPSSIAAVQVDSTGHEIALSGSGFAAVTAVSVDGVALNGGLGEFAISSDSAMTLKMPLVTQLGPVTIAVQSPGGTDTAQITVEANQPPALEIDGPQVLSFVPVNITVGAKPGDLYFLFVSPDLVPSVIPNILKLEIGNALSSLVLAATITIPAEGYVTAPASFPMAGGATFHWQGAVLDGPIPALPFKKSGVQTTQFVL